MKIDEVLYVNGCSYAYGQGIHEKESICIEQRFSRTLSDYYDLTEVNTALRGSCNQRIARRTLVDLIQYKPKLAVIIWSDISRREFRKSSPFDKISTHLPSEFKQVTILSDEISEEVDRYYKSLSSLEQDVLDTLYHMLSVKALADSLRIPCIQLHFREHFRQDLRNAMKYNVISYKQTLLEYMTILGSDELIYGIRGDNPCSFEMIGGGYLDKTSHPDKTSNDNLTKWFIRLIEEKGLL
jgi:hypothetical protein